MATLLLLCCPGALPPSVGRVVRGARELLVVGTVHTPSSRQLEEVQSVIRSTKPDVVVLELDQERLDALLRDPNANYAAEFSVGFQAAAIENESVVMLGDLKGREFLPAIIKPEFPPVNVQRFSDAARRVARWLPRFKSISLRETDRWVNIAQVLYQDPIRIAPIAWSAAATIATIATYAAIAPTSTLDGAISVPSLILLVCQCILFARAWDVLLLSRDDALARSALSAFELIAGLRTRSLLRRRFLFSTCPVYCANACADALPAIERAIPSSIEVPREAISQTSLERQNHGTHLITSTHKMDRTSGLQRPLPFFTLRRPLLIGEERRLNLYEPRWVALMNRLEELNAGSLKGARFGCLHSPSRITAPIVSDQEVMANAQTLQGVEMRLADVVVERMASMVRVVDYERCQRPVTGAPLIRIRIVAEHEFEIDPASLLATDGGFLVASFETSALNGTTDALKQGASNREDESSVQQSLPESYIDNSPMRVLCILGLAHANGVLERCAESNLEAVTHRQ